MSNQTLASKNKPTICLNMIVKNERHVIQRCFDSLREHIDYWVISDTGSTDGTQDFIREYFQQVQIPGELHEHAWKNFAYNRNLALEAAKHKADYILFMDADDYIVWRDDLGFHGLTEDVYRLSMQHNTLVYSNIKLLRSQVAAEWRGVLHEGLYTDESCPVEYQAANCYISSTREGARNQNPDKYIRDAEILEEGLKEEPDNSRYRFYLARSYLDADQYQQALENFKKRAAMGGWEEEVYYSLFSIARCYKLLNYDKAHIIESYLKAFHYRPSRLEALYEAILLCFEQELYELAYQLSKLAPKVEPTKDILFVIHEIYSWRFLDIVSLCALRSGRRAEARGIIAHLIDSPQTPSAQLARLQSNLKVAVDY
ncbi:glycosyltransferase family 2 protein [uncultured Thiothrix sp.]|uniref:tetratricopeptide repeat-containing glycosyltransferase n=1 Tax=uncultured Thiothrix sp. TaxID=223185 RepID=UPI00262BF6BA|nr:glycosyltransferase family 2 protein [uncultured Thiothrix sp.]